MSTEQKAPGRGAWLLPLLIALPFLAAMGFAVYRFGPLLGQLIRIAVRTVVVS